MLKIKCNKLILSLAVLVLSVLPGYSDSDWVKEVDINGIIVYTRTVSGCTMKEFKGEALIQAPLETCLKVMLDVENYVAWRPDRIESRILKKDGNSIVYYMLMKAPWPVKDRDIIVKMTLAKYGNDYATIKSSCVNTPELVPLKNSVVRITRMDDTWTFTTKGSYTFVTYQCLNEPGGAIPTMLANSVVKDQPFKSLENLGKIVREAKYK